jgi:hypothetical protein
MPKQPNPLIKNALLTVLTFLKHKAEERDLQPVITVSKLLNLLPSGIKITYQQLVDLSKDPVIAQSIKSINKNQVELRLGSDAEEEPEPAPTVQPEKDEEQPEGDEEYNPDDFSFDEEGSEAPAEGPPQQEEEPIRPQQDVVKQMAKRAAARS